MAHSRCVDRCTIPSNQTAQMNTIGAGVCLVLGAIISFLVSALKTFAWVKNHTKLVAFGVCVIVSSVAAYLVLLLQRQAIATPMDLSSVVSCVLVQFASAIATHEVIVQPVQDTLVKPQP